ncbi:hypothetical protein F2P81_001373 [Scophthalmus maximus]|uniref:ribonuclease H n=1 Tax=Scophthalmus maximus TaxID=52904 RepID=A0A6A4TVN4_SCOMX|nr:hypothetical protein F2P81_001373 [Scophthalmus maximus]
MRKVEEVAAQSWAAVFSMLDVKNSFYQIRLDEKSSKLTAFRTPFGCFRFLQMPFGINSASEVFQCSMEQLFAGYLCSVIVDGRGAAKHDANLKKVLERVRGVGVCGWSEEMEREFERASRLQLENRFAPLLQDPRPRSDASENLNSSHSK